MRVARLDFTSCEVSSNPRCSGSSAATTRASITRQSTNGVPRSFSQSIHPIIPGWWGRFS